MVKAVEPSPWLLDLQRYRALCQSLEARRSSQRHPRLRPDGCLLEGRPLLNPVHLVAHFDWPVQRIGPRYRGRVRDGMPTRLALFRNAIGRIEALVVCHHGEALIAAMSRRRAKGRRLLADLSRDLIRQRCGTDAQAGPHVAGREPSAAESMRLQRGLAVLLEQFRARGLVLGSVWDNHPT